MPRRILLAVLFVAVLSSCSASGTTELSSGPEITKPPVTEATTVVPITAPPTTMPSTTVAPVTSTRPPATTAPSTPRTTLDTAPDTTAPPRTTAVADTGGACHPSYVGTCLPADASDVDCAGGQGNGPVYASAKRFQVVGPDVFDLDRDGDGIACES